MLSCHCLRSWVLYEVLMTPKREVGPNSTRSTLTVIPTSFQAGQAKLAQVDHTLLSVIKTV